MSDVVFTFTFETYSDAVERGMNRPPDRLLGTLLEHPRVDRLLVANPFRSAVNRAAKRLLGRGDALGHGAGRPPRAVATLSGPP